MKKRLSELIQYKTAGKQKDFAAFMGWSTPYLGKMLRGESLGIAPVTAILKAMPEINARWLILGEGNMLEDTYLADIRNQALRQASTLMDMERYVPVMDAVEMQQFVQALTNGQVPEFNEQTIADLEARLQDRMILEKEKESVINQAMKQSCKHRNPNK